MKKINGLTLVTALLTAAIVFAVIYAVYPLLQKTALFGTPTESVTESNTVIVPNLVGMQESDAAKTIEMLGVKKVRSVPSGKKPGTIVSQDPSAGTEVDPYTTIFVDVSAGTDNVFVPDIVGMDASDALTALSELGMTNIKTEKKYEGTFASVVSLDPEQGTEIPVDDLVTVGIQVGEKKAAVPGDYIGMALDAAVKQAKEDLLIPVPAYAYSDLYEKGTVFMQSVEENAPVMAGTGITLTVSRGKKERDVKKTVKAKLAMPDTATGAPYRIYAREETAYEFADLLIDSGDTTQFPVNLEVPVLRGVTKCELFYEEEVQPGVYIPRAKWSVDL